MSVWTRDPAALWQDRRLAGRLLRGLLWPAVPPYAAAMRVRNALYDRDWLARHAVPARVVSIGNLALGGTGKTPVTLHVAEGLRRRGRRVAIVARGYRKRGRGVVVVGEGGVARVSAAEGGDEAVLMARRFAGAVVVGEDRVAAARHAVAALGADTIVLDDGFQHRRLARDVDVVLLGSDPRREALFPAGPLREGPGSLARASALVLLDGAAAGFEPPVGLPVFRGRTVATGLVAPGPRGSEPRGAQALAGGEVVAAAGIARPERFAATLQALGAVVAARRWFPDHHTYRPADVAALRRLAGGRLVVTTEKDLVKLEPLARDLPLVALRVGVVMEDEQALLRLVAGDDVVLRGSG